jgi:hypothetical protein
MKFKVAWAIDQDKWLPVLEIWSSMTPEQRADAGEGATIIGRWHDLAARTGVAIIEAENAAALARYLTMWNPYMELDVAPVVDDEESAALAQEVLVMASS